PDDYIHAAFRSRIDVRERRTGSGKIDTDIDTFQGSLREPRPSRIVGDIEDPFYFDLPLAGKAFDFPPHLAVSDESDIHCAACSAADSSSRKDESLSISSEPVSPAFSAATLFAKMTEV